MQIIAEWILQINNNRVFIISPSQSLILFTCTSNNIKTAQKSINHREIEIHLIALGITIK